MGFGQNTLSPLQIEDAREAAFRASELQREVEDGLRAESRKLAEAERVYRERLSVRITQLHAGDGETKGLAITTCETVAKGEPDVARLRYERDVQHGVVDAIRQQAFRRAADRRDVDTLLNWSMRRDLAAPTQPPAFDRQTGELRGEAAR